jgi:hypothetical protein
MLLVSFVDEVWPRIAGAVVVVVAFVWGWRRHIDVGLEGEPPSFAITGRAAVVVAIVTAAFGLVVMIWPELFFS